MAQTTGVLNATMIGLYITVADVLVKIGHITSATLTINHALRETTSNDSGGWETYAGGKRGWELSGDSQFTFDADYGFADLFANLNNRTEMVASFSTEVVDDLKYYGNVFITALSATGSTEENETYSFTLKGNGALTKTTVLAPDPE
jgi:predicted secreted protein